MGKQFLSWMAAGLGGILSQVFAMIQVGGGVTVKLVLNAVIVAVLLRAANWVVATFGPKPAVP